MGVPAPPSAAGRSAGQGRPLRFAAAKGSSSNPQRHQHRSAPAPFVSPLPAFPPPHQPHLTYQPFPSPIAAIPGTRRSPSLLSSSVPKRFSQPRSQDPVSSTSLHLSPNPSPFQRGSASFNPHLPRPKIRGIEKDRGFPSLPPPRISMVAAALWGQHRASITFRTPLTLHARLVWDQEGFGQSQTAHMENWTPVTSFSCRIFQHPSILVLSIQVSSCFGWL